jgi:hypothetical protein
VTGPVARRALVAALAVAALALPTSASASAGTAGSGAKAIWGPVTRDGVSLFPVYRDLGVGIVELQLTWSAIAPTRPIHATDPRDPAYRWPAAVAYAIVQAARYHMRILLQAITAPAWANGGRPENWAPRRPSDLAAFFTAAARHYPGVHLWMVWGEPSRRVNFEPETPAPPLARTLTAAQARAPRLYARLLDASYVALKRASPRNLVIGGNTYTTGDLSTRQWIENMRLPDGRPPRMDLYGHNPFSWRAPDLANPPSPDGEVDFSDLGRLSQLVDRELAPPHHVIPLFLSEWTIPTAPDDEFNIYTTPAVQAQWITDAWRIVRHASFIYALGWIHLYDDPPASHGSAGGLLDYLGQRKPGYYAFQAG